MSNCHLWVSYRHHKSHNCSLNADMMLDIIIPPDPVVIIDNESTDPGHSADTTPGTNGTNIVIPTKARSSSRP